MGSKSEIEVKKTTVLKVQELQTNNTQGIIQRNRTGTIVFDNPDLRHGFTQIPNLVLYDPLLGANEKLCYVLLLSYAWQTGSCFPSQKLLAQDMACSERTVISTLAKLRKCKLISVERRGQGLANIYHIKKLNAGYLPKQTTDRGGAF